MWIEPLRLLKLVLILLYYQGQGQCNVIVISVCWAAAHWQSNCIGLFSAFFFFFQISCYSVLTPLKTSRNNVKKCSWELYFLVQLASPASNRMPILCWVSFLEVCEYYALAVQTCKLLTLLVCNSWKENSPSSAGSRKTRKKRNGEVNPEF